MTNRMNLMLHCGAASVDRQQVFDAVTPDGTDTHVPIPHSRLVDMFEQRLPDYGFEVVSEAHGMHNDGGRYFGLFQVAPSQPVIGGDGESLPDDYSLVFGLRNSHDKSFPAGLCCGSGVFVCDNLAFSAEIVVGRRHTVHIMRDLPQLMSNAMGKLVDARVSQDDRIAAYKEHELSRAEACELIVDAHKAGAIGTTKIAPVVKQWDDPAHPEFKERTAWSLFNGFTEVFRDSSHKSKALNVTNLSARTTKLHGLLDARCGLLAPERDMMEGVIDAEEATVAIRN